MIPGSSFLGRAWLWPKRKQISCEAAMPGPKHCVFVGFAHQVKLTKENSHIFLRSKPPPVESGQLQPSPPNLWSSNTDLLSMVLNKPCSHLPPSLHTICSLHLAWSTLSSCWHLLFLSLMKCCFPQEVFMYLLYLPLASLGCQGMITHRDFLGQGGVHRNSLYYLYTSSENLNILQNQNIYLKRTGEKRKKGGCRRIYLCFIKPN